MLQLQIDLTTTEARTWANGTITGLSRKWPSMFPLAIRFARATRLEQLADAAVVTAIIKRKSDGLILATPPAATRINSGSAAYYTIPLNLSTAAINPLFAATSPKIAEIAAVLEIRYVQPGYDDRSTTVDFTIERGVSEGLDNPVDPVDSYPPASSLVPGTRAGVYRITSTAFQLWNPTTSKWHTLTISGAEGAVGINIGAGES